MAVLPHEFHLDRSLFNEGLYFELRDFWYGGVPVDSVAPDISLLSRWWGLGATKEERTAFDEECRTKFETTLQSIGPSYLSLPPFEDHERGITNAEVLAAPFLAEVRSAQLEDEKHGAETLLSLIILLDQMTRNIYRDQEGLRLVYGHYDRLAIALLYGSLKFQPSPARHPLWKGKSAIQTWLSMPLIHDEYAPSLRLQAQWLAALREECEELGNRAEIMYVEKAEKAHADHCAPIESFGRYPHRNGALGRANTLEETEYLKTAETFGVKQT